MNLPHAVLPPRSRTAAWAVGSVTVALWLFASGPAWGHAALVAAEPADGAALDRAPEAVTLTFNEPVEVPSGALRVFDGDAQLLEARPLDTGADEQVAVALPDDLPDGGYVVSYRVLSTDAHTIGGVLTFTVGDAAAVDASTVGEIEAGVGDGLAGIAGTALRGLGYLTTLFAGGAAVFALAVVRRPGERAGTRRFARRAAALALAVTVASIPVKAVTLTGDAGAAWSPTLLGEVVASTFGAGALTRMAALLWLIVLWRPRVALGVPAVAGLVAAASFALDGHQRSVEPTWLLMLGDVVHLVAAATWFAGLVLLALVLRYRTVDDDPVDAAGVVARFSGLALVAFGAVALGGFAMAVPLVGNATALTSTTYGWTLVAKLALVAVAVAVAAHNRFRLVPAIAARAVPAGASVDLASPDGDATQRSAAAWTTLRRTVRGEAAALVLVLLLTGALVTIPPASDTAGAGGIHETTVPLGDARELDLVVDPNRVGLNTLHLYVLDASGRPSADVEDLTLELTFVPEGVGPIVVEPFAAGPGHWIATIEEMTFAGDWEVRVVAGIDRFTEESTLVTVPVAP